MQEGGNGIQSITPLDHKNSISQANIRANKITTIFGWFG